MTIYTPKTQREIDKYFRRLVRRMPAHIQTLFEEERISFLIDPAGSLALEVDDALSDDLKSQISLHVYRFLHKHPAEFLKETSVN